MTNKMPCAKVGYNAVHFSFYFLVSGKLTNLFNSFFLPILTREAIGLVMTTVAKKTPTLLGSTQM